MVLGSESKESWWVGGKVATEAVLSANRRHVDHVYLQEKKRDPTIARIEKAARTIQVPLQWVGASWLDQIPIKGHHGGAVASVKPRQYSELSSLISSEVKPVIVMLDGVEDPYNIGQAIRALYAFGVTGIVLPQRDWRAADATILRSSAGASEYAEIALVESAVLAAEQCRSQGLLVAGMSRDQAIPIFDADLTPPLFLVIGGERRGISRSFWQLADLRLRIPYGRMFDHSLGTVAAAAVVASEVTRQRSTGAQTVDV